MYLFESERPLTRSSEDLNIIMLIIYLHCNMLRFLRVTVKMLHSFDLSSGSGKWVLGKITNNLKHPVQFGHHTNNNSLKKKLRFVNLNLKTRTS